ncbi:MAG TPA: hypothetical protein VLA04_00005 [Verrucomicrobiae bacterium]|nr:hypothetical protein [Verrucomicrobiae bacterium]
MRRNLSNPTKNPTDFYEEPDILGEVETLANTSYRKFSNPDGTQSVLIAKPEDLIPERVLSAFYPKIDDRSRECAKKLLAACLSGEVQVDWNETKRIARLPEYKVEKELADLILEVEIELSSKSN